MRLGKPPIRPSLHHIWPYDLDLQAELDAENPLIVSSGEDLRRLVEEALKRPSITWGVLRIGLVAADQESGMKWRVVVELAGADGTVVP